MLAGWKRQWRAFRGGRPGQRFEDRYERSTKRRQSQSVLTRLLKPAAALVLIAVGIVLCFIPGPGLPLIALGAGLLADNSRSAARALDWFEVKVRKIVGPAIFWWKHASKLAKEAVVAFAAVVLCAVAYGGYRVLIAH